MILFAEHYYPRLADCITNSFQVIVVWYTGINTVNGFNMCIYIFIKALILAA